MPKSCNSLGKIENEWSDRPRCVEAVCDNGKIRNEETGNCVLEDGHRGSRQVARTTKAQLTIAEQKLKNNKDRHNFEIFEKDEEIDSKNQEINNLNASKNRRGIQIGILEGVLVEEQRKIRELNVKNNRIEEQSRGRLEDISILSGELETRMNRIIELDRELEGKNVTIEDLNIRRQELSYVNSVLTEQSDRLQEDLRKSRSDHSILVVQHHFTEQQNINLRSEIDKKTTENRDLIIRNAIERNLNNQQQAELNNRIGIIVEEKEAIERRLEQTSADLNEEITRLENVNSIQRDQINKLNLERFRTRQKVVELDRKINKQRQEQRFLLQRQQVNNQTLVNAQNQLTEKTQDADQLRLDLERLSARTRTENAELQRQINNLSEENRSHVQERDNLGREIHQSNNQIRRLRLEREINDIDSRNSQEDMQEQIARLTEERDNAIGESADLERNLNETIIRLNFVSEQHIQTAARLVTSENNLFDLRGRLRTTRGIVNEVLPFVRE